MDIRVVQHGSPEYEEVVNFRDEWLRKPLGLAFSEVELAAELDQLHFAGYLNGELAACAVLQWLAPDIAKMRQVAVRADLRGRGLGSILVEFFEKEAKQRGAIRIVLHARVTTLPFYLGRGYRTTGAPFEEIGVPHQRMEKTT